MPINTASSIFVIFLCVFEHVKYKLRIRNGYQTLGTVKKTATVDGCRGKCDGKIDEDSLRFSFLLPIINPYGVARDFSLMVPLDFEDG